MTAQGLIKIAKATTLQVAVTSIVVGFIFNYVIGIICTKIGFSMINHNYVGWSLYIITYGLIFNRIWVYVPENNGQIFINTLPNIRGTPDIKTAKDIVMPENQIAVMEGVSGVWPWYKRAGEPISLVRTVPIPIQITSAQTKDNQLVSVDIIAALTAIPGKSLVWYNRTDETAAIKLFSARISSTAQKIIRSKKARELLKDPNKCFESLALLFSGDEMSPEEIKTGRHVSNISIISTTKSDTTEKLDEAQANAATVKAILQDIIPPCNNNVLLEQTVAAQVLGGVIAPQTNLNINPGKK